MKRTTQYAVATQLKVSAAQGFRLVGFTPHVIVSLSVCPAKEQFPRRRTLKEVSHAVEVRIGEPVWISPLHGIEPMASFLVVTLRHSLSTSVVLFLHGRGGGFPLIRRMRRHR